MAVTEDLTVWLVTVSSASISLLIFGVVFGGAVAGMFLRAALPQEHLRNESRDVMKMGVGLIATMSALILGLLVASAKGNYDAQSAALTQLSANIILVDRALALYGPETKEAREALRQVVILVLDGTWAKGSAGPYDLDPRSARAEIVYDKIQTLSPTDESERLLKSEALSMAKDLGHIRWLMYAQGASTVSKPMLIVMVFWLTIIFLSWGLMAPPNTTIIVTLLVSALSVSGAIFLILEMYSPYQGWIRVSDAPLRAALAHLGH